MKKIYYEKVGRSYKPVSEYDSDFIDSFSKGTHLIMSYPGGKSTRYNVDPNYAAMIAAGRLAEDAICHAIYKHCEAKPKERPVTDRQLAAWNEMKAAFGDDFFSLHFNSTRDIAEAGVRAMQAEADSLMQHESVRHAYEHFQLVCELTKSEDNVKTR